MLNKLLGILGIFLIAVCAFAITPNEEIIPVMPTHQTSMVVNGAAPEELRDASVYRWLSGSFRIENKTGRGSIFGSGTMCYYDRQTNTAYIISCGHLFNGGEKTMFIDTWYKNGVKLATPARYTADVIGYDSKEDIAFFKFTPDWVPNEYFPIAPLDLKVDGYLWSAGCDGGREVAAYKVKTSGMEGRGSDSFLITRENSPRHGRSGGGLMTNEGWYVGICVRSSDPFNGTGIGLFVPLSRIHAYCNSHNLGFLLGRQPGNNRLLELPIIDRMGQQGNYPRDYIPLP